MGSASSVQDKNIAKNKQTVSFLVKESMPFITNNGTAQVRFVRDSDFYNSTLFMVEIPQGPQSRDRFAIESPTISQITGKPIDKVMFYHVLCVTECYHKYFILFTRYTQFENLASDLYYDDSIVYQLNLEMGAMNATDCTTMIGDTVINKMTALTSNINYDMLEKYKFRGLNKDTY